MAKARVKKKSGAQTRKKKAASAKSGGYRGKGNRKGSARSKKGKKTSKKKNDSQPATGLKRGRRPVYERRNGFDNREVMSLVCQYFCRGFEVKDIIRIMEEKHKIRITRQTPYILLRRAALNMELIYKPPFHDDLSAEIAGRYHDRLKGLSVVHTASVDDVAFACAGRLMERMRIRFETGEISDEVNIGLSGGPTMAKVARAFATILQNEVEWLPKRITFWALTAAFERRNPANNPSGFFAYFQADPLMRVEIDFYCLLERALVDGLQDREGNGSEGNRNIMSKLDFIVTSGSEYADEHSVFRQHLDATRKNLKLVEEKKIIGDVMLLPFSKEGPIKDGHLLSQALTLFKLEEFPRLIEGGTDITLILAPCGECYRTKHTLLDAVLNQDKRYITHLVMDSKTAFELNKLEAEKAQLAP